jgi:hypothetical protein
VAAPIIVISAIISVVGNPSSARIVVVPVVSVKAAGVRISFWKRVFNLIKKRILGNVADRVTKCREWCFALPGR